MPLVSWEPEQINNDEQEVIEAPVVLVQGCEAGKGRETDTTYAISCHGWTTMHLAIGLRYHQSIFFWFPNAASAATASRRFALQVPFAF